MNEPSDNENAVRITLRIPGDWSHPREVLARMPAGYQLEPESMTLPDGSRVEFDAIPSDAQFPQIFASSCRRPPTDDEKAIVSRYTVNLALTGPGGSMELAQRMMQAAAAIVQAGGAGVFIDGSALAHGGQDWVAMTDDGGPDALSFAFASIVQGRQEVYTMGMQALGFPDIVMSRADADAGDGGTIIEIIRYICSSGRPVDVGHILADEMGPRFQVVSKGSDDFDPQSTLHNPFGRL
ncbi:MAG TPA: hypothetical protein VHB77_07910, partial [Planctomycetaceae bacterium]|nr:hypothetical protein [Planctomycetaceae bacterium]